MPGTRTSPIRAALAALVLGYLAAGCAEIAEDWSAATMAETELRGSKVVAALERCRREQRFYPDRLSALEPRYLPSVPDPTAGDRAWRYETGGEGGSFRLWVEGHKGGDRAYAYDSATGRWSVGAD